MPLPITIGMRGFAQIFFHKLYFLKSVSGNLRKLVKSVAKKE